MSLTRITTRCTGRLLLFWLVMGCTLGMTALFAPSRSVAQHRPNIVLVLTDDQGYGDVGRHVGRWAKGSNPNDAKYTQCSVRQARWHLVNSDKQGVKRWELYDVKADPGEKNDVAAEHPDVVKEMDAAYDKWWADVLPRLENENAAQPAVNPYHELYWKQYRGPGPNNVPPGTKPANR